MNVNVNTSSFTINYDLSMPCNRSRCGSAGIRYTANMPPVIISASASAGTVSNAGNAPMAVMFIGAAKDYDDSGLT